MWAGFVESHGQIPPCWLSITPSTVKCWYGYSPITKSTKSWPEWICSTRLVLFKSLPMLVCKQCSVCVWEGWAPWQDLLSQTQVWSGLWAPVSRGLQVSYPLRTRNSHWQCHKLLHISFARNFFCNRQNICKISISLPWPLAAFPTSTINGKCALNILHCLHVSCSLQV